jgi:dihydroflavonol-4-reductase
MRALVTGGTGFVGSHIARALNAAGHSVRILHRASSKLDTLEGVAYESALGDIMEAKAVRAAADDCDWVFHVAAVADYWRADQKHLMEVNVLGTQTVLAAARDAGVKRVVFTSSAAAVGMNAATPSDETAGFNLPPAYFPYGYSKHVAEGVVQAVVKGGQEVVTVNPVIVIGPGDVNHISGSMVIETRQRGRFLPVAPGGAGYVDVRDAARWHIAAAEHGTPGERYILGTANYTHRDWFDLIADVVGVPKSILSVPRAGVPLMAAAVALGRRIGLKLPIDPTQVRLSAMNVYFNYEKAWSAFGPPQVDMRKSVADTYLWYKARGEV